VIGPFQDLLSRDISEASNKDINRLADPSITCCQRDACWKRV